MLPRFLMGRNCTLLLSGKLISLLGDRMYTIAVAWWILDRTGSSSLMGLFMASSILPGIVLGAFVGPLVDRWNRKKILVAADALRGVAVGIVAILDALGTLHVAVLFASEFLVSLASAFFDPTSQAVVPQIVAARNLPTANSLGQMVSGIATVAGPVLGGIALGLVGYSWIFAANALSYFISGFLEAGMRMRPSRPGSSERFAVELREGFAFLAGRKELIGVVAVVGIAHFFAGGLTVGLPVLAKQVAGNGAKNLGLMQSAIGVGLMFGALVSGLFRRQRIGEAGLYTRLAVLGLVLALMGVFSYSTSMTVLPYAALMLLYGAILASASVFWQSILQARTPEAMTGRVFSISSLAGNVSLPLAYALVGLMLEHLSFRLLSLAAGSGLALFCMGTTLRSVRSMRRR